MDAVKSIVKSSSRAPERIWVDQGSEFYNKDFQKWVKDNKMIMYSTYGESKSAIVERFIRTLKDMMTKLFTEKNTRNWVMLLPEVLKVYNNHFHKSIKMTPHEASQKHNAVEAYQNLYSKNSTKITIKAKYKVGDKIRISRIKGIFDKGIEPNFSHEVFTIYQVLDTNPVTYKLKL